MKKLTISYLSIYQIYNVVLKNEKLLAKQYVDLVMLLIFVLLHGNVFLSEKTQSLFLEKTIHNTLLVKNELLQKTLYYMDATVSIDDKGNVIFPLKGIYQEQILSLLYILFHGKNISFKPVFDNVAFYESVYSSICEKLKLEQDYEFLSYLHNLRKKGKILTTKVFTIKGNKNILEAELYSKYDYFDKEYCNNYRFIITKSNDISYPVGSYVFGTIQPDNTTVILYKDPECNFVI